MEVTLISCTIDPIKTCEECAAVCYDSKPSFAILKSCILSGHTSVLEHANYTFKIEGVSRTLLAQLTRHRIASYSVRSQRYCDESPVDGRNQYIDIPTLDNEGKNMYENAMKQSFNIYSSLINYGIAKEDARMVLPNACKTTIMMTINLRSLGNFMGERLCTRAQWEIRQCAKLMKQEILNTMTDEEKEFFDRYWLAPKCMHHKKPICEERNSCHRAPSIDEYSLNPNSFNPTVKSENINKKEPQHKKLKALINLKHNRRK